jgi:hypothetical protein
VAHADVLDKIQKKLREQKDWAEIAPRVSFVELRKFKMWR